MERPVAVPTTIKSILVPIDFSEPSKKSLQYATFFAQQVGARITLLSVVEPVIYPDFAYFPVSIENDEVVTAVQTKLRNLYGRPSLEPGLIEKMVVRIGNPFQEICAAASELKMDLIIMATQGYTGFKHAWLGSTAERVLRHARCPVLVTPVGVRHFATPDSRRRHQRK